MNLSLEGKRALVCGGSQGIGRAVAEELALMGASCILMARNAEVLEEAALHLDTSLRQQHAVRAVDFSDRPAVFRVVEELLAEGPIEILINNNGGPPAGPLLGAGEEAFLAAYGGHVLLAQGLVQRLLPGMKETGFGRVVNIISTSVRIPLANLGVSNTTRGAMASWAKTLAGEVAPFGITVNSVLPGFTSTGRLDALMDHIAGSEGRDRGDVERGMVATVPMGRFGTPAEVAALAAFYATPAAAYITGTAVQVDGGRTGSI